MHATCLLVLALSACACTAAKPEPAKEPGVGEAGRTAKDNAEKAKKEVGDAIDPSDDDVNDTTERAK